MRLAVLAMLAVAAECAPPQKRENGQEGLIRGLQPGIDDAAHDKEAQIPIPAKHVAKMPSVVKRPAHLEAVPIQRDGSLNKEFKKELILGRDTNRLEEAIINGQIDDPNDVLNSKAVPKDKDPTLELQNVFQRADTDKNMQLSKAELEKWITEMTQHHLDESVTETKKVFAMADTDGNGRLTWDEYHFHFLVDGQIMDSKSARTHKKEDHERLDPQLRDDIESDEDKWREAEQLRDGGGDAVESNDVHMDDGKEGGDQGLSFQQFLGFRHPEHSDPMLTSMARDIIGTLDKDGDGRISRAEWLVLPTGDLETAEAEREEKEYTQERAHEFDTAIDKDHDGHISLDELKEYSNPRNPNHAKQEVLELFEMADSDGDGLLSLDEVLSQKSLFMGSGLMNAGRSMHHEL